VSQWVAVAERPGLSLILTVEAEDEAQARERVKELLAPQAYAKWLAAGARLLPRQGWMDAVGWTNPFIAP